MCTGRCVDLGPGPWSLAPWREIVAGLAAELDEEAFDLIVGRGREVFASLVPGLGGAAAPHKPVCPGAAVSAAGRVVQAVGGARPGCDRGGGLALG